MPSSPAKKRGASSSHNDHSRHVRSRTSDSTPLQELNPPTAPLLLSEQTKLPNWPPEFKPAAASTSQVKPAAASISQVKQQYDGYRATAPGKGSNPRNSRRGVRNWDRTDDQLLHVAVRHFQRQQAVAQGKSHDKVPFGEPLDDDIWNQVAEMAFPDGRHDIFSCRYRWSAICPPKVVKGAWTEEEDKRLVQLVEKYGRANWGNIGQAIGSRSGKQCRERWHNHADPSIKREPFTEDEDARIMELYGLFGAKWAEMSKRMPGRPDNAIKNHFNTALVKRYAKRSIETSDCPTPEPAVSMPPIVPSQAKSRASPSVSNGATPLGPSGPASQLNSTSTDPSYAIGQTPASSTAKGIAHTLRLFDAAFHGGQSHRAPGFIQPSRFTTSVNLGPTPAFTPVRDPATMRMSSSSAASQDGTMRPSEMHMETGSICKTPGGTLWQPHDRSTSLPSQLPSAAPETLNSLASYAFLSGRKALPAPGSLPDVFHASSQSSATPLSPRSTYHQRAESAISCSTYASSASSYAPPFMPWSYSPASASPTRSDSFAHATSSSSYGSPHTPGVIADEARHVIQKPRAEPTISGPQYQALVASSPSLKPKEADARRGRSLSLSDFAFILDQTSTSLRAAETVLALCEAEKHATTIDEEGSSSP